MNRKSSALDPYRTPRNISRLKKRPMGKSEFFLKVLIGSVLGTELVGATVLLALGAFMGFEKIQSPSFSATCLLASAALGAWLAVHALPRFSRDRGRIANFLIDPKDISSSLGSPEPRSIWATTRYGRPTNY